MTPVTIYLFILSANKKKIEKKKKKKKRILLLHWNVHVIEDEDLIQLGMVRKGTFWKNVF